MLEETREPYLASQMLGAAVRDLPGQWEETFGYRPLLAETFTGPECQVGTCYKAAGWQAAGSARATGGMAEKNFPGNRAQKNWLKALHPQARDLLAARAA